MFFIAKKTSWVFFFLNNDKITFVTLNGFFPFSKLPTPLFLTDNIEMDRIPTKIKWKIHIFILYFKFWRYALQIFVRWSHQIFYLLFLLLSFYISRYHFSQIFRTLFNIIFKKILSRIFFFNGFTQIPHPLNDQNPLSVTKVFCRC